MSEFIRWDDEEEPKTGSEFCRNCGARIDARAEICPYCGVRVKSPLFLGGTRTTQRAETITAASILLWIAGILGIIAGILVIIGGGLLIMFGGIIIAIIGIITLLIAILYIIAANSLWHSKKTGGILGIVLCAISIPLDIILVVGAAGLGIIDLIFDIVIIVLIAVGWNSLK